MSEYLLEMSGICKAFSGVQALDHVNFHIRPGKVMCLAGENGCGKSTLVKIISGVYVRDQGEVFFQGHAGGGDPARHPGHLSGPFDFPESDGS